MPHLARISLWSLLAAGEGERGGLAGDENGSMWPRAPEKARFSDGGGEAWHRAPEHTWTGSGCQVCAQRPPAFPRARCHKAAGWGQGVLNSCSTSAASSKSNRTLPSVVGGVVGGGSGGGTGQVASGPLRRALRRPYKGSVDGRCRGSSLTNSARNTRDFRDLTLPDCQGPRDPTLPGESAPGGAGRGEAGRIGYVLLVLC